MRKEIREKNWSKGVRPKEGVLRAYGWSEGASAEERHRALERSVGRDGYATTVDRLEFMRNVASRENNRGLRETAQADCEWLSRWERVEEADEDHRREQGTHHRVRGFDRDFEGRQERVRPRLARNPRKK